MAVAGVIAGVGGVVAPAANAANPSTACTTHRSGHNITVAGGARQHGQEVTTFGWGNSPWLGVVYTVCGNKHTLRLVVDNAGSHDYYEVPYGISNGWRDTWYTNAGNWTVNPDIGPNDRNRNWAFRIRACDQHWYGDTCFDWSPVVQVSTAG